MAGETDKPKRRGGLQFSLLALGAMVAFVAVACVAVMNASLLWATVIHTASVLVLFMSLVAIVYRRGPARAFWVGFAIFGWGYFVLLDDSLLGDRMQDMATTTLSRYLQETVGQRITDSDVAYDPSELGYIIHLLHVRIDIERVVQPLSTLVFAFIGGCLGRFFYATRPATGDVT